MNASDEGSTLVAMDVARVRLEPRLLSPLPVTDNADWFKIQLAGLPARDDAEQKSKEVREAIGEDSQVLYDTETKTWGLLIGARRPQIVSRRIARPSGRCGPGCHCSTCRFHICFNQFSRYAGASSELDSVFHRTSQVILAGFGGASHSQRARRSTFQFAVSGGRRIFSRRRSTL